ncbi:hypothetical protein ACFOW4_02620 [Micromonospora sp. GCM10011542]|uniref:hypothetical protein n=1 Tax=Micromonospora sp. GCM10011542 TaxID=3317337 RepID=UPI00361DB05F
MTLVDELKDRFGVEPVLRVLNVAVSTYYGWLAQAANPSTRRREDAELAVEIAEIHDVRAAPTAVRECTPCCAARAATLAASGSSG